MSSYFENTGSIYSLQQIADYFCEPDFTSSLYDTAKLVRAARSTNEIDLRGIWDYSNQYFTGSLYDNVLEQVQSGSLSGSYQALVDESEPYYMETFYRYFRAEAQENIIDGDLLGSKTNANRLNIDSDTFKQLDVIQQSKINRAYERFLKFKLEAQRSGSINYIPELYYEEIDTIVRNDQEVTLNAIGSFTTL